MANVKPLIINAQGDHAESSASDDYLLAKGISDGTNTIEISTITGSVHKHVKETITLSAIQEASKAIDLQNAPIDSSLVKMNIRGAGYQVAGTDFNLSGSSIIWTGLAIDSILAENDVVEIDYTI